MRVNQGVQYCSMFMTCVQINEVSLKDASSMNLLPEVIGVFCRSAGADQNSEQALRALLGPWTRRLRRLRFVLKGDFYLSRHVALGQTENLWP